VGLGGGNDEREQTLNQMLVEMDASRQSRRDRDGATNGRHPRPGAAASGRFDRQVYVTLPTCAAARRS